MPAPDFVNVQSGEAAGKGIRGFAPKRAQECHKSTYASLLGDICERRLVYWRTRGHEAEPMGDGLSALFETANLLTPVFVDRIFNAYGRLQIPAWQVLEQERRPSDPLFVKLNIGLKVDGVRHVADASGRMRPYSVVEFKTMGGMMWSRIKTLDDLGLTHWTARYRDQVLLGMLGCELVDHSAWLVLINRDCLYECTILEIPFDADRCETLLSRVQRVGVHVSSGTLPRQIDRPDICQNCPFLAICAPKLTAHPDEAPVIVRRADDPGRFDELQQMLSDHLLLEAERKEAESIKARLREQLVPGQRLVVGQYVVNWAVHGKGWRMTVEDTSMEAAREPAAAGEGGPP